MHVVLASKSPQRRELLQRLGIQFEIVPAEVDELREGEPAEVVVENARRKARAVLAEAGPGSLVIGCDTEVVLGGRILGQPGSEDEARGYLMMLSGRTHEVISGLVVRAEEGEEDGTCTSLVTFREIGERETERYMASGEWRGRAGGYALQGLGSTLVARVEGDISNVIGLPLGLLLDLAPAVGGAIG